MELQILAVDAPVIELAVAVVDYEVLSELRSVRVCEIATYGALVLEMACVWIVVRLFYIRQLVHLFDMRIHVLNQ